MSLSAPRAASGIGVAMARAASRSYIFGVFIVASTIFLPHKAPYANQGLVLIALLVAGMVALLAYFPWDAVDRRIFTLAHLFASSFLTAFLIYCTGGAQSSYQSLFFLIILFSYFYNMTEMFAITTVVTAFYLAPLFYEHPDPYQYATYAVTVLFFYVGTYVLYVITRIMLDKNQVLGELNARFGEISSLTAGLLDDMKEGTVLDAFSENLKTHLPTTSGILLQLNENGDLVTRFVSAARGIASEPRIGSIHDLSRLARTGAVLETRQPKVFRLEFDEIDDELKTMITKQTCSVLAVPIRNGSSDCGIMLFCEERNWSRAPFTLEKVQLAVAITKQVAMMLQLETCYTSLSKAKRLVELSHDAIIKSERLATLGEVTSAVEHEINNPLSVIVNWSELYREDESVDPEIRKKFQIMYDMAMRIKDVIQKLSAVRDARSVEFMKGRRMTDIQER